MSVRARCPYTRSAGWPGGQVLDPMDVPCRWFDEKATGAEMIAAVESAARTGGLLVLTESEATT